MTSSPRFPFAVVMIVAACMVGGGVILQQTLRIAACPLCILQRMLALLLFCSAALGWFFNDRRAGRAAVSLLMLAWTAAGMFVAGYQTYLQRFARNVQCSGAAAWWELLVDWAGEQVPLLFYASGLCSDPAWKFIGLSIAEWSLVLFSGLTVLALHSLLRRN
ncbi:MAG: disulfide bond formation protein B [Betaproteobacteria bacterium]|nr:disulfide bond formation protein B [Betaproteobacteria bacterium]